MFHIRVRPVENPTARSVVVAFEHPPRRPIGDRPQDFAVIRKPSMTHLAAVDSPLQVLIITNAAVLVAPTAKMRPFLGLRRAASN